jgi:hypothetical protein
MSGYTILDVRWFANIDGQIGVVAIRTGRHDPQSAEWKAYIGIGEGLDVEADEQHIAALGSPLLPEEAHGLFPYLDIDKYKRDE